MLNTGGTGRAAFRPDHSPEHLVLSGFFRSFKLGEESQTLSLALVLLKWGT